MFGLHMPELLVILVIIVLLFGAGKLPEIGKALGRSVKEFKEGKAEVENNTVDVTPELPAMGKKDETGEK